MKSLCDQIKRALEAPETCEETLFGSRVRTHCLYPSFDQVDVFVSRWGDGFRVTDAGGAIHSAHLHGRGEGAVDSAMKRSAARYGLSVTKGALVADVPSADWLQSAILSVANASAYSAQLASEQVMLANEEHLSAKIFRELARAVPEDAIAKDYEYLGGSGKHWRVDWAVISNKDEPILIKGIVPHYASIVTGYAVFGDIGPDNDVRRFGVVDRSLKDDDAALIRQVAEIVPLNGLRAGTERALSGSLVPHRFAAPPAIAS